MGIVLCGMKDLFRPIVPDLPDTSCRFPSVLRTCTRQQHLTQQRHRLLSRKRLECPNQFPDNDVILSVRDPCELTCLKRLMFSRIIGHVANSINHFRDDAGLYTCLEMSNQEWQGDRTDFDQRSDRQIARKRVIPFFEQCCWQALVMIVTDYPDTRD